MAQKSSGSIFYTIFSQTIFSIHQMKFHVQHLRDCLPLNFVFSLLLRFRFEFCLLLVHILHSTFLNLSSSLPPTIPLYFQHFGNVINCGRSSKPQSTLMMTLKAGVYSRSTTSTSNHVTIYAVRLACLQVLVSYFINF